MKDIGQDVTGDLLMVNDDLAYAESTKLHQRDMLMARQGEYRLAPLATVGAMDYLDDEDPENFHQAVRVAFKKDGMKVLKIKLETDQKLEIEASYE